LLKPTELEEVLKTEISPTDFLPANRRQQFEDHATNSTILDLEEFEA
jgi:hypothetical protein